MLLVQQGSSLSSGENVRRDDTKGRKCTVTVYIGVFAKTWSCAAHACHRALCSFRSYHISSIFRTSAEQESNAKATTNVKTTANARDWFLFSRCQIYSLLTPTKRCVLRCAFHFLPRPRATQSVGDDRQWTEPFLSRDYKQARIRTIVYNSAYDPIYIHYTLCILGNRK
jgi:hypothetical protein